jgi:hypothetical protein
MSDAILERAQVLLKDVKEETKREVLNLLTEALKSSDVPASETPAEAPDDFRKVFGILSEKDADQIKTIIDDAFERIDSNNWQDHF